MTKPTVLKLDRAAELEIERLRNGGARNGGAGHGFRIAAENSEFSTLPWLTNSGKKIINRIVPGNMNPEGSYD
jgi:hypothetical protein